jgi:hypothetical protein
MFIMGTHCHRHGELEKDHVSCLSITNNYARRAWNCAVSAVSSPPPERKNISCAALKLLVSQPAFR